MTIRLNNCNFIYQFTMEFNEFPKMARLSRECIVTEKIDGTNAQIIKEGDILIAGSRTRYISRDDDNFGFAAWVEEHREQLLTLPDGRHFGEWWGRGIQRSYNLKEKRFSLFNVLRFHLHGEAPREEATADPRIVKTTIELPPCLGLVPLLRRGTFCTGMIEEALHELKLGGSRASPGFMRPEGVVCYHIAAGTGFKKTIEKDEVPKTKSK